MGPNPNPNPNANPNSNLHPNPNSNPNTNTNTNTNPTPTPNQVVDASRLARLLYLSECGSAQAANAAMLRAPHGT